VNRNPRDPVGALLGRLLWVAPRQRPVAVSLRTPGMWLWSVFHDAVSDAEAWWFRTTKCQVCSGEEWRWHAGSHDPLNG